MQGRMWMVGLMVIVGALCSTILAGVNYFSEPLVLHNQEVKLKRTVLDVFQIDYTKDDDVILSTFDKRIVIEEVQGYTIYKQFHDEGQLEAVAFLVAGPAFWDRLSAIVSLTPDLETILGFKVLEQKETPGLGARSTEPWFQDQFIGKKWRDGFRVVPYVNAEGPNEIDAITGATETSRAIERMINLNLTAFYNTVGPMSS